MSRLELLRSWDAARKELAKVKKLEADLRREVFAEFFDLDDLDRRVETGCGPLVWKKTLPSLVFPSVDFDSIPELRVDEDEPKSALDALKRAGELKRLAGF